MRGAYAHGVPAWRDAWNLQEVQLRLRPPVRLISLISPVTGILPATTVPSRRHRFTLLWASSSVNFQGDQASGSPNHSAVDVLPVQFPLAHGIAFQKARFGPFRASGYPPQSLFGTNPPGSALPGPAREVLGLGSGLPR